MKRSAYLLGLLIWCTTVAIAGPPEHDDKASLLQQVTFKGHAYNVCTIDPKKQDIRLFYANDQGSLLHDFPAVDAYVKSKGGKLLFATNAGMFEPNSRPVGLLLLNANIESPLNLKEGAGNFYMKPNGVFVLNEKREARIVESGEFAALVTPPIWATQSGPLLVRGGNIHPEFNADSKSLKIRSGVGVRKDGAIFFALSKDRVTFYDFASLFLNKFNCPNALFLDGDVSAFWAPGTKDQINHMYGPIIGITEGVE